MPNISFGERLKRARIRNALSQAELADKMDVAQGTVSNWETRRSSPNQNQKQRLKSILGGWSETKRDNDESGGQLGPAPLAAWLTKSRLQRGLSVQELADSSGLSPAQIYNIESGRTSNPRQGTIRKLEKALETELPDEAEREIKAEANIAGVGELVDFDPHTDEDLPSAEGIYVFYDISERPIYVGQASSIKSRIQGHRDKFWFKNPIVHTAAYVKVKDRALREQVEKVLIRFLKSNAVLNKQNVDR